MLKHASVVMLLSDFLWYMHLNTLKGNETLHQLSSNSLSLRNLTLFCNNKDFNDGSSVYKSKVTSYTRHALESAS